MALTSCQIRSEYVSADKELYQTADEEDPEALLEAASMAGLVGVLRQLGDLAEFAAEVFHCLHEKLLTTAARGDGLAARLRHLEAEFPSVEIPVLSQTDRSPLFYGPGLEWHPNMQTEETLITPSNLPHCMMHSYEKCHGPPQLFLLDKFDISGSGSCLKRYSDPSLLRARTASTLVTTSELRKGERTCKQKKKVSHTTSGEIPVDLRASHAKLHQLFSLEHVDKEYRDPEFYVRLKRRQLNGSSINLSCGTGYMEKYLKNSSPHCERVHDTLDQSHLAIVTKATVCSLHEDLRVPSPVYPNSADTKKYVEMEVESISDDERLENPNVPQKIAVNENGLAGLEGGSTICLEANEANNDGNEDSGSRLEHRSSEANADETESKSAEACEVFEDGRDSILHISIKTHPEHSLELTEVPKENATNSQDGSSMNMDMSEDISAFEITSENGTLMLDTSRDLYTGSRNLSASSYQEDRLSNPNMAEISSYSKQEDPQTMSVAAADSTEVEVPIHDTQRHGACFGGDNGIRTMLESDVEYSNGKEESLFGAQDCFSPQYCIQTHDHGQEIPSDIGSSNLISASVESLPYRVSTDDAHVGVHKNTSDMSIEPPCSMLINLHEMPQTHPEITQLLPPLPPTQWWMRKLVKPDQVLETQFSLVSALACSEQNTSDNHGDRNIENGSLQASQQLYPSEISGGNHKFHVCTEESIVEDMPPCAEDTLNEPSRTREEQSLSAANGVNDENACKCADIIREESSVSISISAAEAKPYGESTEDLEAKWSTEAIALEWFSQNLREYNIPSSAKLEEEPHHDHPLEPPDETEKVGKLIREKDSLVIGIDRSMLRKVSERDRNQVRPRVEEKDSILEIIQSNSVNLRRVDASVRPNLQVDFPVTNFKVATILEKVNTLRQAMVGSDEEHDSDSWSE